MGKDLSIHMLSVTFYHTYFWLLSQNEHHKMNKQNIEHTFINMQKEKALLIWLSHCRENEVEKVFISAGGWVDELKNDTWVRLLPVANWKVKTLWRMIQGKQSPHHKPVLKRQNFICLCSKMALRGENVFYKHALQGFSAKQTCQTTKWCATPWACTPMILQGGLRQINAIISGKDINSSIIKLTLLLFYHCTSHTV